MTNRAQMTDFMLSGAERRAKLSANKSHDYASEDDVLSNFKRIADLCKKFGIAVTTPEGVALFFCVHKLDRMINLIMNGVEPTNESLNDNADDLHNYIDLAMAILHERK